MLLLLLLLLVLLPPATDRRPSPRAPPARRTLSATAEAERQRAEAAQALESERKSIRTTIELQAAADSSGMLLDEEAGFALPGESTEGGGEGARPGPSGRHTKRRR